MTAQASLFDGGVPDDLHDALTQLITDHGYDAVWAAVRFLAPTYPTPSAPARWSDPETSQRASKREADVGRFSSTSRQAKLLYLFSARGPMTDQQATIALLGAHAAPSAFDGCRRRCSDLRAVNFLYDTGQRHKNIGSDDESIMWALTEAGREALIRLDDTGWSR